MKLFIASDHGGFELKQILQKTFSEINWSDLGTHSEESVDYPDYAQKLCKELLQEEQGRGVLICGSGQGISMAANRHKGIRAALCYDPFTAKLSRQHNNSNVLVLGGRITGIEMAKEILQTWLDTEYEGGRHNRRVEKMDGGTE